MAKTQKSDVVSKNNKQKKLTKDLNPVKNVKKPAKTVAMKPEKSNKKSLEKLGTHAKDSIKNPNEHILKKNKKEPLVKPVALKKEQVVESKKENVEKSKPKFSKPLKQKPHAKKSKNTKSPKSEKVKKVMKKTYEPVSIDESAFDAILSESNITKVVNALKKVVEGEVAKQKTSIFEDYNYVLNVSCFKIASCPKRMAKLNLKHSLVDIDTDDIVLVVPDLKRGAKVEYESTIEHYTDLLREAGIENIKIMPYAQLRKEYKSFEEKRKLASTYDYYLCDGRIVGDVVGFCGSIFRKPRTTFHTVRMGKPQALKNEILKSLRRTAFKQLNKGDLTTITVGSHKFNATQVAENIVHAISQLKSIYPGGIDNIRGLDVKINIKGTSSLPIYASTSEGPLEQPYVVGPREQTLLNFKKQANDILSKFNLTKEANLQKLNKDQVERKRKLKETRALLLADGKKKSKNDSTKSLDQDDNDEDDNKSEEESDDEVEEENDEEEVAPIKKPKKVIKDSKKTNQAKKIQKPMKKKK